MGDASTHIFQINALLKNIKSLIRSKFICPWSGGIAIITNNVPNPSDLSVIEKYFKSKLLINYSFNLGRYIAMVRATNMNPGVPQCHNYWKWDHSTFFAELIDRDAKNIADHTNSSTTEI